MTLPRRVLQGAAIMVSRRCTQRQFLLRPDPVIEQVLTFCLGLAAARHGIEVFCLVFLSNHILCAAAHKSCYAELGVMRTWRLDAAPVADLGGRRCA